MPASEADAAPEAPKPNRRRAVVVCAVFAVVLAATIYLLRTNLAYLKWRFIGSEPELIAAALETGAVSPDQVVALVNSGATAEVRTAALGVIACSPGIPAPYDQRTIRAIKRLAANLPADQAERTEVALTIVRAVSRTKQSDLMPVLDSFAVDKEPGVRMWVVEAFRGETNVTDDGVALFRKLAADQHPAVRVAVAQALWREDAPDWAAAMLQGLLEDADAQVRQAAATSAFPYRCEDGTNRFSARLREMLDSPGEDESVRKVALEVLFHNGALDADALAALAKDPMQTVAETAKRLIKRAAERKAEREEARDGSPPDE